MEPDGPSTSTVIVRSQHVPLYPPWELNLAILAQYTKEQMEVE